MCHVVNSYIVNEMTNENEMVAWQPGERQLTNADLFDAIKIGDKRGVFISYKDVKLACLVADIYITIIVSPGRNQTDIISLK